MTKLVAQIYGLRKEGSPVVVRIAGSSDRFLRRGVLLAEEVLRHVNVEIQASGKLSEDVHTEGMFTRRSREQNLVINWIDHITKWLDNDQCLITEDMRKIDGVEESSACGSGCEFISSKELTILGISPNRQRRIKESLAGRKQRKGWYALIQRGTRTRLGLTGTLRPIINKSHSSHELNIIQTMHPMAKLLDPLELEGTTDTRLRVLVQHLKDFHETLVAVDHYGLKLGSPLDLDLLIRLNNSSLMTCLPSSNNWPELNDAINLSGSI
jgi:hypothetical protein